MEQPQAGHRGHRSLSWTLRLLFLALLVASPWPFGSATPRPGAILSAALYLLFGVWVFYLIASDRLTRFQWTATSWVLAGLLLGLLQLAPLPPSLLRGVAPASSEVHHPPETAAASVLGAGFRPISVEPFSGRAEILRLGALAAAFFLAGQLFGSRREQRLLVWVVAAVGVALALSAVYQKARWGTLLYGRFPVESGTPFGPFVNHNHFAGFVEMCLLLTLGGALGQLGRSTASTILLGGSALIMGTALAMSHSRGGLVATAAGAIFVGATLFRARARERLVVGVGWAFAALLFIFLAAPRDVFQRAASLVAPTRDPSISFRLTLWADSLRLARHSPVVGTGLGTFAAAIPPYRRDRDETRAEFAESDIVQHACETGLLGTVIVFGFAIAVARRFRQKLAEEPTGRGDGILLGAGAGCLALLVHSGFDFNTRISSNAFLLATLLGLLGSSLPATAAKGPLPGGVWLRRVVAAVALLTSLALATWTLGIGFSRQAAREVDLLRTEPEAFAEVAAQLACGRSLAPSNPEVAFKEGQLFNEEAYRAKDSNRYRELRFEQARSSFERAARLAPARGRYWFELAWTEGNLRRDASADSLFQTALRLEPAWSRLRANYALYLASRGRVEEALAELDVGRGLKPGLTSDEAVSLLGPYVRDDPALLRRAAGDGEAAEDAVTRYLAEQRLSR
jgi:O-antigen ligase